MTTILVTTDFSDSAHWATNYALELAYQLKARLVLVHAYDPLPTTAPAHEWMTSTTETEYYQALSKLSRLRQEMLETTNNLVDVSVVTRPMAAHFETPATIITQEAMDQKADLLVMGLVGDNPLKARQLGSLSIDMIPYAPVPMLLIPPGVTYHQPQNMVLAIDLSKAVDVLALDTALRFVQLLKASLDVICVNDEPTISEQQAAQHLRHLLRHQPHTFSFLPGLDVALALEIYLEHHKVDLITLLPKPHSRLRTWIIESVTQEVARLSTVPVLAAV